MRRVLTILFLITTLTLGQQVTIATYNLLNYGTAADRNNYFRTVMTAIDPDIVLVQEIISQAAVDNFLNNVLNNPYSAGIFLDGPDTDNAIFFKTPNFEFLSNIPISTSLRDINQFTLVHNATNDTLIIYSVHLKAGSGTANEQQRLAEANILRQVTDNLPPTTDFIIVGDFNLYTSSEPAYQVLLDQATSGYVLDPIDMPGDWHADPTFALIHTQSTRTRQFGGGANGGMDDRFDLILASQSVMDAGGIEYLENSYQAFGNDGLHFNDSINALPNNAVPPAVANALHYASDHLPVVCQLYFEPLIGIAGAENSLPEKLILYQNYPNPFNASTVIGYELAEPAEVNLVVYDMLGQKVFEVNTGYQVTGAHQIRLNSITLPTGVYYYQILNQVKKMILLK